MALPTWAARYNTGLLIKLTLKGVRLFLAVPTLHPKAPVHSRRKYSLPTAGVLCWYLLAALAELAHLLTLAIA